VQVIVEGIWVSLRNIKSIKCINKNVFWTTLKVNSYNDDYPHSIVIDPENLSKVRPLRLGDIHNFLPDGVEVDRTKNRDLHARIIKISGDQERKLEIALQSMKIMKDQVEVEDDDEVVIGAEVKKERKEKKSIKVRSLKKQVQAISAQVKEKLAQ